MHRAEGSPLYVSTQTVSSTHPFLFEVKQGLSKCIETCTIIREPRTDEHWCLDHGTVNFVQQPWDAVKKEEYELKKYSDSFLYKCATTSTLDNIEELASLLGISDTTLSESVKRHSKLLRASSSTV